ncbi:tRNA preQ1(34) S-adenosylmethionine ribosyltransferase-isomerase QueA [Candidatus Woesebacteria bacterium RIFCSPLOWO2_01_FULL_39_61]|uniref:S-adenosylmethionine:tRNA ribosyltransferase-isomerase n=1 Tax=Candidatus Woesebacteria bacterium RIFCSPHIGHO2_02_FULL_39_13 TaxID=1802505 RepID=A0A1F7Z2I0_9BACT|nr:MAG: tRNA preQ1(34) S-adenosylmethionine ribosyltransferase-isomerase QueA [Candidatus Woesebacteria bacterium RIFCSPHIGHO2_01_FULL_39_95]OGM33721.1 MAG: tRNA preQ1(34) S-adenosylmethionine ribosyltransferase-isomerase QueA [Candidatus Woesebacteria bacterium RIFCSPHIGHO2_02_FULL_39_13]OGM38397.1 MAG: tRNA preQ1(34) S-adenosylmethionine ribosyltransferase-isomerase QueA [Candidatus Woesebacteria bacterium RIFCSPHIGHO2_12_FULL_40_20]OGM66764.1 MAG: tRNA preQ1(34) S-adenosylmethionine ribosyltr
MKLSQLDYHLNKEFIAQFPASPRDHSRLLEIDRRKGLISHQHFYELPNLLNPNDVLVFNQSKVLPARLIGKRKTGGKAEILLLKKISASLWEVITKPGFSIGDKIYFEDFEATIRNRKNYITEVEFSISDQKFRKKIKDLGHTPLPPYIKTPKPEKILKKEYQTVYAKVLGSSAAPTAGLHFTKRLLKKLKEKGVQLEFLTLHVGLGTFAPIKQDAIAKHKIHSEFFDLPNGVATRLNDAKSSGKRIIAVGTTTCRVIETCAYLENKNLKSYILHPTSSYSNLFIYPPHKFKFVDGLITNFHLPKSTLLALVCAFVSYPNTPYKFKDFSTSLIGKAYSEALNKNYRFYSFGDACLVL